MKSLILALILASAPSAWAEKVFTFHLFVEPHHLDPQIATSTLSNYLFASLYRGLYLYQDGKLRPDGAKSCTRKAKAMICRLNPEHRWSDGTRIRAEHYVNSFRRLIDPANSSPQSDVLFTVKNAKAIWRGEKPPQSLGVWAKGPDELHIEFETEDPEFEYKLIHPALTPLPAGGFKSREEAPQQLTNGPYAIEEWKIGQWIALKPNPHYPPQNGRPPAKIYFIDDDSTALRLYETGKLQFLRRVTGSEIPRFKNSKEFHQIPMARFDYIGFGPKLVKTPERREALLKAVDFSGFMKLFDTVSPPGCPSLPSRFMDKAFCMKADIKRAKSLWGKENPKFEFYFSRMGGEDIARAAEWFQGQWKRNLDADVELKSQEQASYLRRLKTDPPDIFRKGVSLDRPTCLAAVEIFTRDHPENYIRYDDPEYERLVRNLARSRTDSERKRACRKAIEHLLNSFRLLPLGEMYFSVLARPTFTGWRLNSLNQLDLSELRTKDL